MSATPADHEPLQLVDAASRRLQPLAAPQAEDHRRQRRDEAERGPAAPVEAERLETRKEVEKPGVEGPRQVRVLVEVREKARVEVRPVGRNADRLVIEVGPRQRIQHERRPEPGEQHDERDRLHADRGERQQEQERVAETNLRERVFERPVGARAAQRAQEDPERDQRHAPPRGVKDHAAEGLPFRLPGGNRERQRRANQERERRLDQIVERAALPRNVLGVVGDQRPEAAVGEGAVEGPQPHRLREHEQHHEAAEGVDGDEARRRCGRQRRRFYNRLATGASYDGLGVRQRLASGAWRSLQGAPGDAVEQPAEQQTVNRNKRVPVGAAEEPARIERGSLTNPRALPVVNRA